MSGVLLLGMASPTFNAYFAGIVLLGLVCCFLLLS
jgi:hypothetical protein